MCPRASREASSEHAANRDVQCSGGHVPSHILEHGSESAAVLGEKRKQKLKGKAQLFMLARRDGAGANIGERDSSEMQTEWVGGKGRVACYLMARGWFYLSH